MPRYPRANIWAGRPGDVPGPRIIPTHTGGTERAIRADKRELAGMRALYGADPPLGNLAAVQGAKERLARDQRAMREPMASANARSRTGAPVPHRDPRREWAGDMPKAWLRIFEGAKWNPCGFSGVNKCMSLMMQRGDGARAEVYVEWDGSREGHVFVAENRGGCVVFIDPQTGDGDVSRYFKLAKRRSIMIARIDNLQPSGMIDECCTSRSGKPR